MRNRLEVVRRSYLVALTTNLPYHILIVFPFQWEEMMQDLFWSSKQAESKSFFFLISSGKRDIGLLVGGTPLIYRRNYRTLPTSKSILKTQHLVADIFQTRRDFSKIPSVLSSTDLGTKKKEKLLLKISILSIFFSPKIIIFFFLNNFSNFY